ncbi:MAG TPA: cupredoxin domain-containing protein [Nitrosarchaeum sp.]|nr:cupredoxin domain-containing protein [Nitrosarchaeum sp.]
MKPKLMIPIVSVIAIIVFVLFFGFIGQGSVKPVQVSPLERIQSTVSFQNIDNETVIVGISGISGVNPIIISRTDYNYFLTIYNNDTIPHMFFIDGLNANSKIIQPGKNDTMVIYSLNEGEYGYYDRFEADKKIGDFKIVKVGLLNQYP